MQMTAEELFKKAREFLVSGKNLKDSFHFFNLLFNRTLKKDENTAELLFHMAAVCMKEGHNALSILLFKEAANHRDNFVEAFNNIGYVYKKEIMEKEALEAFEKSLQIAERFPNNVGNKDKAEYLTNIGSMYIANGTPKKALEFFDKALKLDDSASLTKWNRSLACLELGDYESGFKDYDFGERQDRFVNRTYGIEGLPLWDGLPDKKKTVVVIGEQGIGDEIMFASVLSDAMKNCNVVLEAHPRLADLFRLSFPSIPIYGTRKDEKVTWPPMHKIDAKIGIGSLARLYRKKKVDFPGIPYLSADQKRVEKYRLKLEAMGDKPKIGISWKGGSPETGRANRCIPLEKWKSIFSLDVDFISLQYDKDIEKEVSKFEKQNNICLNHWQKTLDDYDETAALLVNLDLIISVPQSVVHLAGALGVPTIQLSPFKALWQVGPYGEDAPWYKSVKNVWQDASCNWEPVMEKVKGELCSLLQMSTES